MRSSRAYPPIICGLLAVAACSSGTEPDLPPIVDCSVVTPTDLPVGGHTIIDAAQTGCVRIPPGGSAGAEYLYVALATQGKESSKGVSVPYELTGGVPISPPVASIRNPRLKAFQGPTRAEAFHRRLRALERELSERPGVGRFNGAAASTAPQPPPVIGEERTFNVLASSDSTGDSQDDYVQVTGTAKYVGSHVAIFLDDAAPSPGYSQADIDQTGAMFDSQLYPIGVTAFGGESDINGDNLVLVLLTHRVTRLAACGATFVIGYFFAIDLIPSATGSNGGEIFYGLAPDPECGVLPAEAAELLPGVFIHEFQHMINYNHHALLRRGSSEDTWLNEGLSTFAEELGGRLIPDSLCANNDCLTQFMLGNLINSYSYLHDVESNYLIGPGDRNPPIPLAEYGAAWLFVRWVADHFAQTPIVGTDLTQRLVATNQNGSDNVTSVTGMPFPALISEWQMANYLDDLPGFTPANPRLGYASWNFRQVFDSLHQQNSAIFPVSYPLVPDSTSGSYSRSGVLLGGSGRHVLLNRQASSAEADFKLTGSDGARAVPETAQPRIGLVRVR